MEEAAPKAPQRIPACGPETGAGLRNVLGGRLGGLSVPPSLWKPRRAGPHLHLTAIAPEARTDGDIAWPGARTGVVAIARWDLGREPTPQSRPDMKAPRELRRGAFLPEPQCPHSKPERSALGPRCLSRPSLLGACALCSKHQFAKTLLWPREAGRQDMASRPYRSGRSRLQAQDGAQLAGPRRRPSGPCAGPTQPSACFRVLLSLSPPHPSSRVAED